MSRQRAMPHHGPAVREKPLQHAMAVVAGVLLLFSTVAVQLVRLAIRGHGETRIAMTRPLAETYARPNITDRNGRLLASDIPAPTLDADPSVIVDVDEAVERLTEILSDLDPASLRRDLSDRSRRFVRIRRGLSPNTAQRLHDLGLPGLVFRYEPKRAYPAGLLAGHVLGHVSADNQGLSGIERHIDDTNRIEPGHGSPAETPPVRLSIDIGVQHAVEEELRAAVAQYRAQGAAGLVLDVATGEVLAAASLPEIDPARPAQGLDPSRLDKLAEGLYELGSVFKPFTVAMALESGVANLDTVYDVRAPLRVGRYAIRDHYPSTRPLSVRDIFAQSSNVGAARIGLDVGAEGQRTFLRRIGLLGQMRTEAGPVAAPMPPSRWGPAETVTISYGHGLAVAPLQLAAAAATLLNGGFKVTPTFIARAPSAERERIPLLKAETSVAMRELFRRAVAAPNGTGRRADVPGYEIGGKTGTAELPGPGGYLHKSVIASFLAAFPMSAPKYLVLVMLHEPQPTAETEGRITAGANAAPLTARLVTRIAPLLDVIPSAAAATGERDGI
jgi:cell division protein FtsI (penicillin-binding protein 3)